MFKRVFAMILLSFMFITPTIALASDGVGLEDALMQQNSAGNAEIVRDLGTENIDLQLAKEKLSGVSNIVGKVISFGLTIVWLLVMALVVPDMIYILIPPLRKHLYPAYGNGSSPSNANGPGSGMASPLGMGGYGGFGGGGFMGSGLGRPMGGMGGLAGTQYHSERQWISDAARDAMEESFNSVTPAMVSSMGFQQSTTPNKPKRKMVLVAYFKRKTLELVLCTAIPLFLISGLPYLVGGLLADIFVKFSMKGVNYIPNLLN